GQLPHRLAPGGRLRGCDSSAAPAAESQPSAPEHPPRGNLRTASAGWDETAVSDRDCGYTCQHAPVVALSYGAFRRHSCISGARLPHYGEINRGGEPTRWH